MPRIEITQGIFLLLSLVMGFLYWNSPDAAIKQLSQLVLFLLVSGSFLFIIFLTTPSLKVIQLEGAKEFFDEYTSGLLFGVGIAGASAMLAVGLDRIINFTGSITAMSVAMMSDTSIVFLVYILPFMETMILVGITVVLGSFLQKKIPYSYVLSGIIASLVFAAFHFVAVSGGQFEYSINGFVDFVFSIDGGLIHFSFGLVSVVLFLGYKSYILPFAAHHLNNLFSSVQILGMTNLLMAFIILDIGIFLIVVYKKKLARWSQFSIRALTAGL